MQPKQRQGDGCDVKGYGALDDRVNGERPTASKRHAMKMEVTAEAVGFAATLCTCDRDAKTSSD